MHGHVAVAPGAAPSKAPARRPKCDARVVLSKARLNRVSSRPAWGPAGLGFETCVAYLAAALLQKRARAVEPQRNHGDDAPTGGGGVGGEAREVLWR